MSSPLLQCFFCQHINPAGASFCNGCGSPLNLQPCPHCSAIDSLSATHCHKCGAAFSLPDPLEKTATPRLAPQEQDHTPTLRYPAFLPQHPQQLTAWVDTTKRVSVTHARRHWGMAALGLAALIFSIFYVLKFPDPPARQSTLRQAPDAFAATAATPAPLASPKPETNEKNTPQTTTAAPLTAIVAIAERPVPIPITRKKIPPAPPALKDCAPEVATLGLCHSTLQQE